MIENESPATSASIGTLAASEVELPSRFIMRNEPGVFELSWRWRTHAPMAVFVTSAAGAIIPGLLLIQNGYYALGAALFATTIGYQLARWATGIVRIRAQYGHLDVEHKPLWWPGHSFALDDIQELFVDSDGREPRGYSVYARTKKGERILLVGMLQQMKQAEFIEAAIEQHLKNK